jgi:hypothetical protein
VNIECDNCGSIERTLETRDDGKTWLCVDVVECLVDSLPVKISIDHTDKGPIVIPVKVHKSN